jgi:hypothetical protein
VGNASLLLKEDFSSYPGGASVIGQTTASTIGFTATEVWSDDLADGFPLTATVNFYAESTGLSYAGLQTSGGLVNVFRTSGTADDKRLELPSSLTGGTPSSVWLSALVQIDASVTDGAAIGIRQGADRYWGLGVTGSNFGAIAGSTSGVNVQDTGLALTLGQTHLLVGRIDDVGTGNDRITVWLDPVLGGADPTGGTIVNGSNAGWVAGNASFNIQAAFLNHGLATGESAFLDELRLGTTFADVTPVPEPSTVGLLTGLAGLSIVMLRRRCKR